MQLDQRMTLYFDIFFYAGIYYGAKGGGVYYTMYL